MGGEKEEEWCDRIWYQNVAQEAIYSVGLWNIKKRESHLTA